VTVLTIAISFGQALMLLPPARFCLLMHQAAVRYVIGFLYGHCSAIAALVNCSGAAIQGLRCTMVQPPCP
jgi:hypothetical protein